MLAGVGASVGARRCTRDACATLLCLLPAQPFGLHHALPDPPRLLPRPDPPKPQPCPNLCPALQVEIDFKAECHGGDLVESLAGRCGELSNTSLISSLEERARLGWAKWRIHGAACSLAAALHPCTSHLNT